MFNLDTGATTPLSLVTREDLTITDFEIYNERLYIMDANKNLILKYSLYGNSFNQETSWLKDDTSIREGTAIAIDGSVWLLCNNGEIKNFMKSVKQDLLVEEIRPKLIRVNKIWTNIEAENIYFMDAGSKRIVILTKEGKIKQQYVNDALEDFKDFVVDEAMEKIFILDGMKIFEIKIE